MITLVSLSSSRYRAASRHQLLARLGLAVSLLLLPTAIRAQSSFGSQPVGSSSAPQPVDVISQAPGSVSTIQVLTMGAPGLDFADTGGSCATATFTAQRQACTESITFTPGAPGLRVGAVLLLDSNNDVLGVGGLSGTGLGGLAQFSTENLVPVAGVQGAYSLVMDGQIATQADLYLPSSVAIDGAGNLFIADSAHNRIRRVDASTHIISTIAGDGSAGYSGDGSVAVNASLNNPSGIALDGAGNLYVADTGNNAVREVVAPTGIIITLAGTGSAGYAGDGGAAFSSQLNQPSGIAFSPGGDLYIADTDNNVIRTITPQNGAITPKSIISTFAGDGLPGYTGDGGLPASAELDLPFAVAFDSSGNLYIADSGNNCIRMVASGVIKTIAGSGPHNAGYSGDSGPAVDAELSYPTGVAIDLLGNVYIADTQNAAVRKVSPVSDKIYTVISSGSGSDYFANALSRIDLYGPTGLLIDGAGNLYVSDRLNMVIRQLQSNIALLNFTGTPTREDDTSLPHKLSLGNVGNWPLVITALTPGANATIDPASTTCAGGSTLKLNASCTIGAVFAPTTVGNPLLGTIQVTTQSVNSPLQVDLAGDATPLNATQVTMLSSQNPVNAGQNLTLTAVVTTGTNTGTLDGTVSFYDGSNVLGTASVNANGIATFTISSLSVGMHSISGSYPADSNGHLASTSPAITQVVDEATTTSLSSSAPTGQIRIGSSVTFTAAASISGNGGITPDGSISFFDGATQLGTVQLQPGVAATFTTASLANGMHSITAAYNGDPPKYILSSISPALPLDVLGSSTVALSSSLNPSTFGVPVTLTAAVTFTGTSPPSGDVNFFDGSNPLGTGAPSGSTGIFTFITSSLTSGNHVITAAYQGDSYNGSATSPPMSQGVNVASTATTLLPSSPSGTVGKPVTLTATVAAIAGTGPITGAVTFSDGATTLGTAKIGAGNTATLAITLAPGAHSLLVSYAGDANNAASTSAPLNFVVNLATTTVALKSSASSAVVLSPLTFTAVVSGNGPTPSGTVSFLADGAQVGSSGLDSTGTATFTDSGLTVGTCTISASYAGDANNTGSTSTSLSEVIQPISTTTGLAASSTGGQNPQVILVANTTAPSGPMPTGTITFNNGSTVVGSVPLDPSGVATLMPSLSAGTYSITASYGGDSIHSPSTSVPVTVTPTGEGLGITIQPTTLTLASSQNGTVTITLTSVGGYSDTVGLGCVSVPAAVTCHFSSNSVDVKASQTQTVQLTVDTNLPLSGGQSASLAAPSGHALSLAGIFLPVALFLGFGVGSFRKRCALLAAACFALAGSFLVSGCTASFSQRSAAPGTYTMQVSAVGAATNTSFYQSFTLTVTQ